VSRRAAVRQALEALGPDAPNPDLVRWVKEHHGYDVANAVSAYKNVIFKQSKGAGNPKGKPGRKPRAAAAPPATASVPVPAAPAPKPGSLSDDLTALARIVARYGAGEVRGMVAALETVSGR
jgi:hypothetical protein